MCDKKGSGVAATGSWKYGIIFGANIPWKLTAKEGGFEDQMVFGFFLGP